MANKPQRRQVIDPSVAEIMGEVERKQEEARLPREARTKKIKEREKAKNRLPGRVNWDLPPKLKKRIIAIAEQQRIPVSQVASFLLANGLERLESGEISLEPYLTSSKSPRYDWNLVFPPEK